MSIPSDDIVVAIAVNFRWHGQVSQTLFWEKFDLNFLCSVYFDNQIVKCNNVLTCSSFIISGRSCDLFAISSTLSNSPSEFLGGTDDRPLTGLSFPGLSPPGDGANPSTPRQLLSAEAGRGAKSEAQESSGSRGGDLTTEVCRNEPAKSGQGLRITPALELLGIHRAKKSAWEY